MDTTSLNSLQMQGPLSAARASGGEQDGPMAYLGSMFSDFTQTIGNVDETAQATLVGGADPHALVEAMAQAQLAMDTAVTLRDKTVEAYQQILNMPV